jgi:DNA-binding SARP family transcriptional activator
VGIDGVPLEMRSGGKSLAVLKYMAARSPRVTSRDALIESLWPDCEPSVASNLLRVAMHGLRRLLNPTKRLPELVISQDGAYRLNPLGQLWVDADNFEEALQRGVELERRADIAGPGDAFREAEELYLRDFLEEDLYEVSVQVPNSTRRRPIITCRSCSAAAWNEEAQFVLGTLPMRLL